MVDLSGVAVLSAIAFAIAAGAGFIAAPPQRTPDVTVIPSQNRPAVLLLLVGAFAMVSPPDWIALGIAWTLIGLPVGGLFLGVAGALHGSTLKSLGLACAIATPVVLVLAAVWSVLSATVFLPELLAQAPPGFEHAQIAYGDFVWSGLQNAVWSWFLTLGCIALGAGGAWVRRRLDARRVRWRTSASS